MTDLTTIKCTACRGDSAAATEEDIAEYTRQIPEWAIVNIDGESRLERVFKFDNFKQALAFTNRIGELAEAEDHHPALLTEWGRVTVTWWTHKIHGLHQNDFIMAAKTDRAYSK